MNRSEFTILKSAFISYSNESCPNESSIEVVVSSKIVVFNSEGSNEDKYLECCFR
ncbi:MAG: hypothetical protein ACOC1K_04335 [Nanoarchaeota archaeon]